jgi:hypothetical protein
MCNFASLFTSITLMSEQENINLSQISLLFIYQKTMSLLVLRMEISISKFFVYLLLNLLDFECVLSRGAA